MRSRANTTDRQNETGTNARYRAAPPSSKSAAHDLSASLLDLQQSHGNRFVAGMLSGASERSRCHCGGTCSSCQSKAHDHEHEHAHERTHPHDDAAVVSKMMHNRGKLTPEMAKYIDQQQTSNTAVHARCPEEGCADEDPLARHQGSGLTECNKSTGLMEITDLTEHCAGDCVFQHEHAHQLDDAPCCARVKACIDAAPDAAGRTACRTAYDAWFTSMADHAECVAYTVEVDCLTRFIAGNCDGHHDQSDTDAAIGGAIGGVLGGIGGFIVGGVGGAIAGAAGGAAVGSAIGAAVGAVSPGCCTTLKSELATAKSRKTSHCAAAVNHPCPV